LRSSPKEAGRAIALSAVAVFSLCGIAVVLNYWAIRFVASPPRWEKEWLSLREDYRADCHAHGGHLTTGQVGSPYYCLTSDGRIVEFYIYKSDPRLKP